MSEDPVPRSVDPTGGHDGASLPQPGPPTPVTMRTMTVLDPLLRYWHAQDELFERVEPHPWGAVVSDPRYPMIQEANYARVEARSPVAYSGVEAELLPALRRSGAARAHVVIFHPETQLDLLAEASTRGERLTWDLVMEHTGPPAATRDRRAHEVLSFDGGFWRVYRGTARLFGIEDEAVLDQLQALERDLLIPTGRRWFEVREEDEVVSIAALLVLGDVAYLDHVVTIPAAGGRGHAGALTHRLVAEAFAVGVERIYLLAEPEGAAAAMYERRGFRPVTRIASWVSPLDRS